MPERNAERTKTAILEAAEDLFARQGFERTSLHEIAAAAGFARSTPAYFFKTKQQLYDTVLENALERGRAAMRPAFEAAIGAPSSERALDTIVGDVLAFLAHDEKYVLIMQREALAPRPSLAALLTEPALAEARMGFAHALGHEDPDHFFLELSALTWFPFAQARTFVAALGFDARDPQFLKRHRERIVRLLAQAGSAPRER
jgi:AcrR family transcriptional regulator